MTQRTTSPADQKISAENIAFIDGQNLHLGVQQENWQIDHQRFRVYLKDKYKVKIAYYFFGYLHEDLQDLYSKLQEAGFVIVFKEHSRISESKKRGNVDTDMVFEMMKTLIEKKFDKIVLVSGDGDYKKIVDYLIKKQKFAKILFPNKKFASSLYKKLTSNYYAHLGAKDIRQLIEYKKRGDRKHEHFLDTSSY